MHIAEGFLPPLQAGIWTAIAAPFVIHGARSAIRTVRSNPEAKLLLGAAGAFTFAMSAIKLPSVSGSSSHPTGTGVGAVLFKPPVMAFLGMVVLLFQALLLAHGGLTTLGANVMSMAVVGPWVGFLAYRALHRAPFAVQIFVAMAAADLATYLFTSFQLSLAFPDPSGGYLGAFTKFAAIFALSQIPLAVMEGLVGILLFRALVNYAAPEMAKLGVVEGPTHV